MNKKLVLLLFFIGPLSVYADVVSPNTTCTLGMTVHMPEVRFDSECSPGDIRLGRWGQQYRAKLFDGCLDTEQMNTVYHCIMYAPAATAYSDETGDYSYDSACLME